MYFGICMLHSSWVCEDCCWCFVACSTLQSNHARTQVLSSTCLQPALVSALAIGSSHFIALLVAHSLTCCPFARSCSSHPTLWLLIPPICSIMCSFKLFLSLSILPCKLFGFSIALVELSVLLTYFFRYSQRCLSIEHQKESCFNLQRNFLGQVALSCLAAIFWNMAFLRASRSTLSKGNHK